MTVVRLDGTDLDVAGTVRLARGQDEAAVPPACYERVAAAHGAAVRLVARSGGYGHSTGVGANRGVVAAAGPGHAARLLASHAGGAGPLLDPVAVRGMLAVRVNQLAAGASGISPPLFGALVDALRGGALPAVHRYGAVGTGDLTALAALGLCLTGERAWAAGPGPAPVQPAAGDAVALMSSSALTLACAALAADALEALLRAGTVVAALSATAADAAPQAWTELVWQGRAGAEVAAVLAGLVPGPGTRLQDPYPLRAAPAWAGPLAGALAALRPALAAELNRGGENPLVDRAGERLVHHAGAVLTELAAQLDAVRAAVVPFAHGSASRLRLLHDSAVTGLAPFLAAGAAASSGTMICEYTAAAAVAELRQQAHPVAAGWVELSLGQESGASFATQAALSARDAVEPLTAVLAAELVVATRALRLGGGVPHWAHDILTGLPDDAADHDLGPDLAAATAALPALAECYRVPAAAVDPSRNDPQRERHSDADPTAARYRGSMRPGAPG
jgi:histidine ammonia-lyase